MPDLHWFKICMPDLHWFKICTPLYCGLLAQANTVHIWKHAYKRNSNTSTHVVKSGNLLRRLNFFIYFFLSCNYKNEHYVF
jgi:hypothetical protein